MFSSGRFIVLPFIFMFVIHLRLTVLAVRKRLRFSFSVRMYSCFPSPLFKKDLPFSMEWQ